jgi:hypothetical protein
MFIERFLRSLSIPSHAASPHFFIGPIAVKGPVQPSGLHTVNGEVVGGMAG